jgi:hypothetical protein
MSILSQNNWVPTILRKYWMSQIQRTIFLILHSKDIFSFVASSLDTSKEQKQAATLEDIKTLKTNNLHSYNGGEQESHTLCRRPPWSEGFEFRNGSHHLTHATTKN